MTQSPYSKDREFEKADRAVTRAAVAIERAVATMRQRIRSIMSPVLTSSSAWCMS